MTSTSRPARRMFRPSSKLVGVASGPHLQQLMGATSEWPTRHVTTFAWPGAAAHLIGRDAGIRWEKYFRMRDGHQLHMWDLPWRLWKVNGPAEWFINQKLRRTSDGDNLPGAVNSNIHRQKPSNFSSDCLIFAVTLDRGCQQPSSSFIADKEQCADNEFHLRRSLDGACSALDPPAADPSASRNQWWYTLLGQSGPRWLELIDNQLISSRLSSLSSLRWKIGPFPSVGLFHVGHDEAEPRRHHLAPLRH